MIAYWFGFIAALIATLALTPAARRVAVRARIVDRPDGCRKLQKLPVPLLGGVAVLLGWGLGLAFALSIFAHPALPSVTLPALVSLAALALLGICDDVHRLRARWKLSGQCLAVLPIVLSGCRLQHLTCCGWQFDVGLLSGPATVFWLVLGINAVNLLDGMDGMASIVAVGIAVTIAGIDFFGQTGGVTLVIIPLAGALLGFLAFNFPPARIYLGDTGSMAIGLVVSLAALLAAKTDGGATNLTILAAVMAIPLADTTLAVVRRSLSGCGFWQPDRGHLHHRLLDQGLRPQQILMLFFGVSLVWAAIVAVASHRHSDSLAWERGRDRRGPGGAIAVGRPSRMGLADDMAGPRTRPARARPAHGGRAWRNAVRRGLASIVDPSAPAADRSGHPFGRGFRGRPGRAFLEQRRRPRGGLGDPVHASLAASALLPPAARIVAADRRRRLVAVGHICQRLCRVLGRASRDGSHNVACRVGRVGVALPARWQHTGTFSEKRAA